MSIKAKKLVYLIYGISLSILLAVSGVLLMISCINIYQLGDRPFTPEAISEAFGKIQVILYVTIGGVAIGAILKILLPLDEPKLKANTELAITLKRLENKYDISSCEKGDAAAYKKAKALRIVFKALTIALCIVLSIPALIVAILPTSYTMEYNGSVVSLCFLIIPSFIICAAIALAFVYVDAALMKKQIATIKLLIAECSVQKIESHECSACKRRKERSSILFTRIIVIAIAVIFVILGIFNGGMDDVLSKAINICTECIGLG